MQGNLLLPAVVFVIVGALTWMIALRTADGRIKRNRFVGIRTRATRASEDAWRTAHQIAKEPTIRGSRAILLSGVVLPAPRVGVVLALAGLLYGVFQTLKGARAAVHAVTEFPNRATKP
jgi:hypothetical protein